MTEATLLVQRAALGDRAGSTRTQAKRAANHKSHKSHIKGGTSGNHTATLVYPLSYRTRSRADGVG